MIVNYTASGWEIIAQRTHGLVAAAIANEWKHEVRTRHWIETLIAIAEHDDAQVELERDDLLTEQGGPVDFAMRKVQYDHCLATMTRAYNKSTYVALLCSIHLEFLCKDDGASGDDVKTFIKEQKKQRTIWLKTLGMTTAQLDHDYRLLEWCDALSLLICQHKSQPEGRSVEISQGPDGQTHQLRSLDEDVLTVEPWPFEKNELELLYEYCLLPQLSYNSVDKFREAYQSGSRILKTITFKRSDKN
ncbi:DUF3891 family protein [Mucilaginibacter daejeonensis]|uniref:DUF3891 family protein n=1 Tax=Mucilaginibacter daejeonensis TaxID=398049 RepID=UPI001D177BFF|nr:DUF3891 family protein [Mucilaginibacter daejeonensis]UEG55004.1 DUF3891 family protein [Mucilaginibacter daejeonensis]